MPTRKCTRDSLLDAYIISGGITYSRWIVGEGAEGDAEYIVHLSEPRFIAKFWDGEPDETPPDGMLGKLSVDIGDCTFYDILWLDEPLRNQAELLALFKAAEEAIERYSFKKDTPCD